MIKEKKVEQLLRVYILIVFVLSSLLTVLFFYVLVNAIIIETQIPMMLYVLGWSYTLFIYGCGVVPICLEEFKESRIRTKNLMSE